MTDELNTPSTPYIITEAQLTEVVRRIAENLGVVAEVASDALLANAATFEGATSVQGGSAGLVPAPIAGQQEYFLKGNGSWAPVQANGNISGGGTTSYSQVTKLNVTASTNDPKIVDLPIQRTSAFCAGTPNALLFVAGDTNVIETACDFDNGDADDFTFDSDFIEFDGTMHLKTSCNIEMESVTDVDGSYLHVSKSVNLNNYKSVEQVNAGGGQAVGIAMLSSGGGAGTWNSFEENNKAVLLTGGAAYDSTGRQLVANWSSLSDAEKAAIIASTESNDSISMLLHFVHSITMSTPTSLGTGYVSTSNIIELSDYETIEDIELESGRTVGIALLSSGGGAGTWKTFEDGSTVIMVDSDDVAYDCEGNVLSQAWSSLSDSDKLDAFDNASGVDFRTTADTLGAFRFIVYSPIDTLPTCTIYESQAFSTFRLAVLSIYNNAPVCKMNFIPKDQLVVPSGLISLADYDTIHSASMVASVSGSAAIRYAVTPDLTTYYAYDSANSEWVTVTPTAFGVLANGMSASELAAVPASAWTELEGVNEALGFAYALSMTDIEEDCYVDAMTLNVDMRGDWRAAVYDEEYTYAYTNNINLQFKLLVSGNWKINYDAGISS